MQRRCPVYKIRDVERGKRDKGKGGPFSDLIIPFLRLLIAYDIISVNKTTFGSYLLIDNLYVLYIVVYYTKVSTESKSQWPRLLILHDVQFIDV